MYENSVIIRCVCPRTTDTQWRHKSKISKKLGRCGRQNNLPPYLKIWDWDWIFGRAVKAISYLGIGSPWTQIFFLCDLCNTAIRDFDYWPFFFTNTVLFCRVRLLAVFFDGGNGSYLGVHRSQKGPFNTFKKKKIIKGFYISKSVK